MTLELRRKWRWKFRFTRAMCDAELEAWLVSAGCLVLFYFMGFLDSRTPPVVRYPLIFILVIVFLWTGWGVARMIMRQRPLHCICPHCGWNFSSADPWVCGTEGCGVINKTTLWYSFLYRCEHCGTAPKSFECRRCGWLIFFDVEQARTGKDPHAARPAGEVFSTSRKAASERLGQRVAEAEQEEAQWREAASAQAEESKAESAEDELERLFMTDWNAGVRMDNLEVRLRAEIDKENDPVLRQRKLERLEFLLAKYSN